MSLIISCYLYIMNENIGRLLLIMDYTKNFIKDK